MLDAIAETHATDVAIPAQVEHGGRAYTVTAIDHDHRWGHIDYDDSGGSNAGIFGENIQFPDEAGSYGSSAYPSDNLASLTSISVPATVTRIGNASFNGCTGATSVTFGEGSVLAYVSDQAFRYCRSLKSVTLPDSVEVLGTGRSGTFDRCTALESVNILSLIHI